MFKSLMLAAFVVAGFAGVSAAQDAAAGETVFKKCKTCHMVGEGAANRVGPELNGIIGRAIAGLDFNYSNAMKEFAAANGAKLPRAEPGKIVHGAVSMVEAALQGLSERKIVELDDERKAAMVSNLLVVLCSDKDTQPIVNTGTLYN